MSCNSSPLNGPSDGCSIELDDISLNDEELEEGHDETGSIQSLKHASRRLLGVDEIVKSEVISSAFTSEIAIDQTWGEWMQELPGTTWTKFSQFAKFQWKWSKNVVNYQNLPEWLKDNKFLISCHRLPIYSFTGCMFSAFRIHTETGNIWTHLLGSLLTFTFAIFCFASRLHKRTWSEQIVYGIFFLTAFLCMGFSCLFHTVINHSPKMFRVFSRLDYSGISLLVIGSYLPWLYYAYFCYPITYVVYTAVVCVIGLTGMIVSLWEKFDKPKYRTFRAAVFLTMGLSAVVPAVHFSIRFGWSIALEKASLGWMILMGCLYVMGTLMYMFQVPERFFPGKFDIWGQSHQIFHIFVLIAVFVHYHGISELEMHHLQDITANRTCINNILNISVWT